MSHPKSVVNGRLLSCRPLQRVDGVQTFGDDPVTIMRNDDNRNEGDSVFILVIHFFTKQTDFSRFKGISTEFTVTRILLQLDPFT